MAGASHLPRPIKNLVAVQGFGRPVAHKGLQYERNFLSGSSAKSFTPDTADKSDRVEQFRSYLVRKEIDVKLDRTLRSRIYNNGLTKL
jgi:hypothetical protein